MAASRLLLLIEPCRADIPLTRGGWQDARSSVCIFRVRAYWVLWPAKTDKHVGNLFDALVWMRVKRNDDSRWTISSMRSSRCAARRKKRSLNGRKPAKGE
jgi:hypothetical protein